MTFNDGRLLRDYLSIVTLRANNNKIIIFVITS